MKVWKRIYYSMKHSIVRSLLLMIAVFVLGSFFASSYAIFQSSQVIEKTIKTQLGAKVLVPTTQSNGVSYSNLFPEYQIQLQEREIIELLNNWSNDSKIQAVYTTLFPSFSGDFLYLHPDGTVESGDAIGKSIAVAEDFSAEIESKEISIAEGRGFTKEENQSNQKLIIINEDLRHHDGSEIQVGETLTINSDDKNNLDPMTNTESILHGVSFEFEVIGKFKHENHEQCNKLDFQNNNKLWDGMYFYVPQETLKEMGKVIQDNVNQLNQGYSDGDVRFFGAYFELNSVDEVEDFKKELRQLLEPYNDYRVVTSLEDYYVMADSIERYAVLSMVTLVVSIVGAIVLLTLLLHYFIGSRRKEIGMYLAIGETRKKISIQIFGEIWICSLIGLLGSLVVGYMIGKGLAHQLLEELASVQQSHLLQMTNVIGMDYIFIVLLGGTCLVVCCCLLSVKKIMQSSPKDLLS